MTAQLTGHGAHTDDVDGSHSGQPYLARRQNWVNQLERHAYMQPGATALRFLGNTVTWAGLRDRVESLGGRLDMDRSPAGGCRGRATLPVRVDA